MKDIQPPTAICIVSAVIACLAVLGRNWSLDDNNAACVHKSIQIEAKSNLTTKNEVKQ